MKKIVSATDLGGAPLFKNDLREVFNSELWDVMQAMLAHHDGDTQGIIVSGCVLSANASNFDMTAGIVYLDGEFMRIAAATNQTFTKFIAPATPTSDSRTFADGTTHALVETKTAELVGSSPGGRYVTIANLVAPDARRLNPIVYKVGFADVDTSIMVHEKYTATTDVDTMLTPGIQFITSAAANAPTATGGHKWLVITSEDENNGGFVQIAIQTAGAAGDIYVRVYAAPSGPWGAWANVNT